MIAARHRLRILLGLALVGALLGTMSAQAGSRPAVAEDLPS